MNYFFAIFLTAKVIAAAEPSQSDVYSLSDSGFNDDYSLSDSRFKLRRNATWHKYLPECWARDLIDDEAHEVFDKIIDKFLFDHVLTKERYADVVGLDDSPETTVESFEDEITEVAYLGDENNEDWFGNNLRAVGSCRNTNFGFKGLDHNGKICLTNARLEIEGKFRVLGNTIKSYRYGVSGSDFKAKLVGVNVPGGSIKAELFASVRDLSAKVCMEFKSWWGSKSRKCFGL